MSSSKGKSNNSTLCCQGTPACELQTSQRMIGIGNDFQVYGDSSGFAPIERRANLALTDQGLHTGKWNKAQKSGFPFFGHASN